MKTSQFAPRKRALPKRANLTLREVPAAQILSTPNSPGMLTILRTAGDVSGGGQILMAGKSIKV